MQLFTSIQVGVFFQTLYLFKLFCVVHLFHTLFVYLTNCCPGSCIFFPINYIIIEPPNTYMQLFVQSKSEQPTSFRQHNQKQLNTALHFLSLQNSLVYRASIVSQILTETVYHSRILFSQAILD